MHLPRIAPRPPIPPDRGSRRVTACRIPRENRQDTPNRRFTCHRTQSASGPSRVAARTHAKDERSLFSLSTQPTHQGSCTVSSSCRAAGSASSLGLRPTPSTLLQAACRVRCTGAGPGLAHRIARVDRCNPDPWRGPRTVPIRKTPLPHARAVQTMARSRQSRLRHSGQNRPDQPPPRYSAAPAIHSAALQNANLWFRTAPHPLDNCKYSNIITQ